MIEKGHFAICLNGDNDLDIGELSKSDWRTVDKFAKEILDQGRTENNKIAFVAGFLLFVVQKQAMEASFEGQH